ncbi:hypothetical protein DFH27DRAFT_606244 [Peziza echinospora]|nr:hypothetical protein DFH27DRAFT_606244 [Peziza echinospora]
MAQSSARGLVICAHHFESAMGQSGWQALAAASRRPPAGTQLRNGRTHAAQSAAVAVAVAQGRIASTHPQSVRISASPPASPPSPHPAATRPRQNPPAFSHLTILSHILKMPAATAKHPIKDTTSLTSLGYNFNGPAPAAIPPCPGPPPNRPLPPTPSK